jgi:DNA-binding transcriptional MerR regulator
VRRLNFIQRAKALGFSSEQIQGLLRLTISGEAHTRGEVKSLTEAHIDEIAIKIKDLQKIKRRLSQISSFCDGSAESARTCPILESLFDDS